MILSWLQRLKISKYDNINYMNSRIFLLPVIGATTFFILLFSFTKIFGPIPFSVNSVTATKSTTFDVTGEGKVTANPDVAVVTVGIQATASTVKAAQDQINSSINKVSEAIKKLGIDPKDIKTTNYNVNPSYDFNSGQKITGYSANTNLLIKVRQIEKANQVIDTATSNGANQVGGISFDIDDEPAGSQTVSTKTKSENEARVKAVEEAKKKASDASKIAGFKLGRIINYSENFGGSYPVSLRAMAADKAIGGTPTQVEPGSNDIVISVTLSYEIQ